MRKRMALTAVASSIVLLVAACGSSGGGSGSQSAANPGSSTSESGGGGASSAPSGSGSAVPGSSGTSGSAMPSGSGTGGGTSASGSSAPSGSSGSGGAAGGTFSVAIGPPHNLFPPANCYASECTQVIEMLWAGLDAVQNGKLQYRVAKSITSDDQTTWDIKLKQGYKFHNGEPVNADAFIRAWNYTAYGPNAQNTSSFFTRIKGFDDVSGKSPKSKTLSGLKKVGDYEFKVTLNAPFSQFPYMLTYTPAFAAVSKKCLNNVDACNEGKMQIGDGPYEMDGAWAHNDHINVKKVDDYQGNDAGKADEIQFKIYQKMDTAYRDWQAGNLDIVAPVPSQWKQAKKAAGDNVLQEPDSEITYLGLPLYVDYLKKPKMRHALSMAINRQALIDNLLAGLGKPAKTLVSPVVPGGGGDHCSGFCTYNPDKAKKLAKEAGGLPSTITLWVNQGAGNSEWVQAVGDMWKKTFGVKYKIKTLEFPQYLDTLKKGKGTGPFRLGWIMDFPSMVNYLKPIYFKNAPTNYSRYDNPKFEKLMKEGSAASSQKAAIKKYTQAEDLLIKDMPVIPMYTGESHWIYSKNVSNVKFAKTLNHANYREVTVNQ